MAKSFNISKHQSTDSLQLYLVGGFDGSSAADLISVIEDSQNKYNQIIVNTFFL